MYVASKYFKALSRVHHLPHHRRLLRLLRLRRLLPLRRLLSLRRLLPLRRLSGTRTPWRLLPSLNFGSSILRSYR